MDAGIDERHPGQRQPLSGACYESYFDLHVVTLDANQKERATTGTWRSIARLTPGGWDSQALVGCQPRKGEQQ